MAFSAHSDPELVKEHFCDRETLESQASTLANLIKNASNLVVFTGAGVSTSAGIPDFRGPEGVWTMQAQGRRAVASTPMLKTIPTPTHMALVALQKAGILKFVISQNVDGMHMRSGIERHKLAELHGNTNLEICDKCGKEYLRDFECRRWKNTVFEHYTDRYCVCGGQLKDSIINFGESLPKRAIRDGFRFSKKSDVYIVLGSSLTVSPASQMPFDAKQAGAKLVICNLQKTSLDGAADLRIFAKTDDLMKLVMQKLSIPIEPWVVRRLLSLSIKDASRGPSSKLLSVAGIEPDGTPASYLSQVKVSIPGLSSGTQTLNKEPFTFSIPAHKAAQLSLELELSFMGHLNEPNVLLKVRFPVQSDEERFVMNYDPFKFTWDIKQCPKSHDVEMCDV